ncbi:hypothetical protein HELRODRAFT_161640 [Helobdella robusta]|uniref:SFR19-like C-terminal domain-containing protein n=1 Tax=Helobdella robusta TaxID=6412 RepID=T1ERR0_HELRO|nr:hypothetical protein HELRODRAFT_161640 [Helobdella robusta]ESO02377.1 hypothetical protein HELRODRAFT_161640 [Helobdella robusta]
MFKQSKSCTETLVHSTTTTPATTSATCDKSSSKPQHLLKPLQPQLLQTRSQLQQPQLQPPGIQPDPWKRLQLQTPQPPSLQSPQLLKKIKQENDEQQQQNNKLQRQQQLQHRGYKQEIDGEHKQQVTYSDDSFDDNTNNNNNNNNNSNNNNDNDKEVYMEMKRLQEVEEMVKNILRPHYIDKHITKEDYKLVMKKAVPKIMNSRCRRLDEVKVFNFVSAYIVTVLGKRHLVA